MSATFRFRRIASDREGYYYHGWDKAVRVSVIAEDETKARVQARNLSGEPPSGCIWKFKLDEIDAANGDRR